MASPLRPAAANPFEAAEFEEAEPEQEVEEDLIQLDDDENNDGRASSTAAAPRLEAESVPNGTAVNGINPSSSNPTTGTANVIIPVVGRPSSNGQGQGVHWTETYIFQPQWVFVLGSDRLNMPIFEVHATEIRQSLGYGPEEIFKRFWDVLARKTGGKLTGTEFYVETCATPAWPLDTPAKLRSFFSVLGAFAVGNYVRLNVKARNVLRPNSSEAPVSGGGD